MHNYANAGYVIKAIELEPLIPEEHKEEYNSLIDDGDADAVMDLLFKIEGLPHPEYVFVATEEIESELEEDTMYLVFDVDYLYERTPKPVLNQLRKAGIDPEYQSWVTYS